MDRWPSPTNRRHAPWPLLGPEPQELGWERIHLSGNASDPGRQAVVNGVQQTCLASLTSWGYFGWHQNLFPQLGSLISWKPRWVNRHYGPYPTPYLCPSGVEGSMNHTSQFMPNYYPRPMYSLSYILALINLFFFLDSTPGPLHSSDHFAVFIVCLFISMPVFFLVNFLSA